MRVSPSASPKTVFTESEEKGGADWLWEALEGQGLARPKSLNERSMRTALADCPWVQRLSANEARKLASSAARAMSETNKGFWPTTHALSECARRYFGHVDNRVRALKQHETNLPRFREWQRQSNRGREIAAMVPTVAVDLGHHEWMARSAERSAKVGALMAAEGIDLDQFKADNFAERPPKEPSNEPIDFVWPMERKRAGVAS